MVEVIKKFVQKLRVVNFGIFQNRGDELESITK